MVAAIFERGKSEIRQGYPSAEVGRVAANSEGPTTAANRPWRLRRGSRLSWSTAAAVNPSVSSRDLSLP